MKTTLLDKYIFENLQPVRKNDKEYAGPCPACGGKDRFLIFLDQGKDGLGRYLCRQCGKTGDAIQFLRDFRGLSFQDACRELDKEIPKHETGRKPYTPNAHHQAQAWEPKDNPTPEGPWQDKARKLIAWAAMELRKDRETMAWLEGERGLTRETVEAACLGFIPENLWRPLSAWGLPEEMGKKGKPKKLWIPGPSLAIPVLDSSGNVQRCKFRRFNPGPKEARYLPLKSPTKSIAPLIIQTRARAWAIVEAELDAHLLAQEAGHLVNVAALGSAAYRPDTTLMPILEQAPFILISLDHDEAGYKAAVRWWEERFPFNQLRLWPVPEGKDVCDAWKLGWDLGAWIEGGLPPYLVPKPSIVASPTTPPEPFPVSGTPDLPPEKLDPLSEQPYPGHQAEQKEQAPQAHSMEIAPKTTETDTPPRRKRKITPAQVENYRAGRKWIHSHLAELESAGWTRAKLYRIGSFRFPYNWGLAWSAKWTDPNVTATMGTGRKLGQVVFTIQEHTRTVTQTAQPRP